MIKIKTAKGFECELDEEVLDDYEFLEQLMALDEGEVYVIPDILKVLFGERTDEFKESFRGKNGRIKASELLSGIFEIFSLAKEASEKAKNS